MRNDEMLDSLRKWFRANKHKLTTEPIQASLRRSELEDEMLVPPLYKAGVDLRSEKISASFTVWGSGEVSVIIMNNVTASELIVDDRRLHHSADLDMVLNHYCTQIATGGPFTKCVLDHEY